MTDIADRTGCFGAYDVRGRVPEELDEDLAYDIGRAYATFAQPSRPVAVGYDVRLSSIPLAEALKAGLHAIGVDTLDIGMCGTEVVYFAAAQPGVGGGIIITASHNPRDHNGMKFVRAEAIPISGDSGLREMQAIIDQGAYASANGQGQNVRRDFTGEYLQRVVSFVDVSSLDALRIVTNAGNGCAGPYLDALAQMLPLELFFVDHEPDGSFPHGVPNPLLPDRRPRTAQAVERHEAEMGVAWDGDFDRCFFFDERAIFVEGYYLVGLLARRMLEGRPGERVIHDPRLVWNTMEIVEEAGGVPIQSKTGHAFIKERMRAEDAVYGGEMSAHHYFRDFYYCDSGMIPWLLVAEIISQTGRSLSDLIAEREALYPCSGEINREVEDQSAAIARVRNHYGPQGPEIDKTDGLSMAFDHTWRFNLRTSNTEPVIRLNVETSGDRSLLQEKTEEILQLIY